MCPVFILRERKAEAGFPDLATVPRSARSRYHDPLVSTEDKASVASLKKKEKRGKWR